MFKKSYTPIKHFYGDESSIDKEYTIVGIVRTARKQKDLDFVKIRDGSIVDDFQLVIEYADCKVPEDFTHSKLQTGSSLKVRGTIVKSPKPLQPIEMKVNEIIFVGDVYDPSTYPFSKKDHSLEHIRQYPELRGRYPLYQVASRVRDVVSRGIHEFYDSLEMRWIHTPILTASDCEGAGEVVCATTILKEKISDVPLKEVVEKEKYISSSTGEEKEKKVKKITDLIDYGKDMYHRRVYLTVSGQLHVESVACQMGDSYTFGPIFRAEGSDSYKHLGEAWLVEPELWHIELKDLINHVEDTIKYSIEYLMKRCMSELEYLDSHYKGHLDKLTKWKTTPFIRIKHSEAVSILKEACEKGIVFENAILDDMDFSSEHEKYLTEKHFDNSIIVITHWPRKIKAFYMLQSREYPDLCECFDVLCPYVGEIVGGSMREHDYEKIMKTIDERGMNAEPLEYYMRLRKYGPVPHGGYGIGLDRLIMLLTSVPHIKEVVSFPRTAGTIYC
jgi:asparaginyl-tRNA synthetase